MDGTRSFAQKDRSLASYLVSLLTLDSIDLYPEALNATSQVCLERITLALFRAHGMYVGDWPREVRAQLWPAKGVHSAHRG